MKLVFKTIIPLSEVNSNSSTKGGYIFELMDYGAVTLINEIFVHALPENHHAVTNTGEIKYIKSVFAYNYIEVYAEIIDVSPGSVTINTVLNSRDRKSNNWDCAATATFKFSIVDANTRRIVRIPKEVINEIKG